MSGAPTFRAAGPEDRPGLDRLFEAVYGPRWPERTSSWRYLPPTDRRGLIWIAECDGLVVGAQPSHEITIQFDGAPLRGALLLDVMTRPDYRRRGLFSGVVEGLRLALHGAGVRVLLTTPNGLAARGFRTLPAWHEIGELIPLVRPVRWRALLRRSPSPASPERGPGEAAPTATAAAPGWDDPGLQSLWRGFSTWCGTCVVRDGAFLGWRFGAAARRPYRFAVRRDAGEWRALAVTTPGRLMDRGVLFLVDLIAAAPGDRAAAEALADVAAEAAERGVGAIVAYQAPRSALLAPLRRAGFWQVPRILRPRPYTVWMSTDLDGARAARLATLSGWHMSLADSDLA